MQEFKIVSDIPLIVSKKRKPLDAEAGTLLSPAKKPTPDKV